MIVLLKSTKLLFCPQLAFCAASNLSIFAMQDSGFQVQKTQGLILLHFQVKISIRFSPLDYSVYGQIHSYPLYAVARPFVETNKELHQALMSLVE